jgi:autotransporter family porin
VTQLFRSGPRWLARAASVAVLLAVVATAGPGGGLVAAASFTTTASAPASVAAGGSIAINLAVTSASAISALVDLEVYNAAGAKVHQQWWDNQAFAAGQRRTYASSWQTSANLAAGAYTVKIGVFSPGWATLHHWNNGATQFSVTRGGAATATRAATATPTRTPTRAPTATPTRPPTATPSPTPPATTSFRTLPPGAALPSGAECATRVRRSSFEPRPANYDANHTRGRVMTFDTGNAEGNARFGRRVDGNFVGTTDEIIQWAACKWGFDEDIARAVAVKESWWWQSAVGDNGESFGLMQVREPYHYAAFPEARTSTAMNVDYALAWRRSCFEGYFSHWVPAQARGDEWGCAGLWFSGRYRNQPALDYIAAVQAIVAEKTWRQSWF